MPVGDFAEMIIAFLGNIPSRIEKDHVTRDE
jgi:hypothetical protein